MSVAIQKVKDALGTGAVCRFATIEALQANISEIAPNVGNKGLSVDNLFTQPNRTPKLRM